MIRLNVGFRILTPLIALDLSKKLKELGVKQKSLFYWNTDLEGTHIDFRTKVVNGGYCYSAFTVAELGEILPSTCRAKRLETTKVFDTWVIRYVERYEEEKGLVENIELEFSEKSEADARAKILIYLLENKLIQLP